MERLQATSRKRKTYQVEIKHSLLWECALGIAAVTNRPLHHTLEKTAEDWQKMRERLSPGAAKALKDVEENNTWKTLLQLLHEDDFSTIEEFIWYIHELPEQQLKEIAIPFLGEEYERERERAARGDQTAIDVLKQASEGHLFIPRYIEYITSVDPIELKDHLTTVMQGWYEDIILKEADEVVPILEKDAAAKWEMVEILASEKLVEWATGGIEYLPEPGVHRVLLIPHTIYRPWNMEADLEGTKVFYYPVADESLEQGDPYKPSPSLIQRHKALGDEARLRIVKLLSERDQSLQELTERLEMGKTTVHHHLKLLRAAQIVQAKSGIYGLRTNVLETILHDLKAYIDG
ncbi:metalloregulator ArsR/SmtB family transcription factor [Pseudalkalibacillus sp. SCS-8]|uniref:ArsR/SmtB family transcription factor n=1 Tax=Pseudalkalibacillus nanhaiensis TaxID=3115291 RepID=UPI0032DA4822